MDQNKVFIKLKDLGHVNNKRDELQEYCKINFDQIIKFLPRRILNSDGADVLDCLLNGLPDNLSSPNKTSVKIIDVVLQSMRQEATSLTHCSDVVSRLCLELSRHSPNDLVRWCNDSIQSIIGDNDVNMIWRDILPECLSALSSHNEVKHCGTVMTVEEYKEQCIHALCQCHWTEKQLVQLVAMFKDMQLARNDHKQVVNKVCSYMIDIPPDVLPPLVHQLFKLCKLYHVELVLAHLSHYYSVRLYSKLEPPPQDSESTTMDIDDIVAHSPAELSRSLSTVVWHAAEGAGAARRVLRAWPRAMLLRAPFLIDLALALADKACFLPRLALALADKGADYRSVCLDVIRSAIEQRVLDELRSTESAWVRAVLPPDVDVASLLKVLTTESANHRQLTVVGLINLGFSLLGVPRARATAAACWSHGKLLLVRLSKAQPETAHHILAQLADRLATDCSQRQYAECLHVLCKLTPLSVERSALLGALLEAAAPAGRDARPAAAVLDAVHPLLNFSTRTRDTLVMVCRKGLYSRDTAHRCVALSGLLSLLRHVRLPRGACSQPACSDQHSATSYLTQLTLDLHATHQGTQVSSRVRNEAMCMEVVSILRRCLVQDATVKHLLYTKLYDCAREKTALHESILELLYEHLTKYLPEGGVGPPLLLDKCVQVSGANAVLTEPISNLLYAIAQFLQPTEEEDLEDILSSQTGETGSAYLRSKLTNIMDDLCSNENFGQIDMEDPSLTDLTPESRAKCLKVQQILQSYEALIAHKVMQWSPSTTGIANQVYNLYKACNQLMEQTKTPSKSKKGNKTMNETRETVKSQKSQKSQKEKGKGPVKLSTLTKDRAGPFKPLPCLWDLRFCLRLVELLYSSEVPWAGLEQRNQLRARRDFHQWALRGVLAALVDDQLEKRPVAVYAPRIAAVLYKRCLCRFEDMCDFDDQTALGCMEVFKACLTLLLSPNHSLKIESFLPIITGIDECTASIGMAAILDKLHAALAQLEEGGEEGAAAARRHAAALLQPAALLLDTPIAHCVEMSGVIAKFEEYLRTSKQECLSLVPALLAAACRDQQDAPLLDDLLLKLTVALGRVDEEDTSAGEECPNFPSIDSTSGHAVLGHVCAQLAVRSRALSHQLARARDLAAALPLATHTLRPRVDRELKELYKSLVLQLCQLTSWTSRVGKLRCCVGGGSDKVLGACVRLYATLAQLVKQLPPDIAPHTRLERLLKLSGKKLSGVTDNLITYLEASQPPRAGRVLRDARLVPRLVLAAEQFSNHVILLANKAKLNLQHYLSLGTARDFRIRAPLLQEAFNNAAQHAANDDDDINEATTEVLSPAGSESEEDRGSDEETTKKKRRRVS